MIARIALTLSLLVWLSACGGPPPAPGGLRSAAPRDGGEAVWHLRAGLNVAALNCRGRGRTPLAGHYSRVLARHKGLLATAHAAEQRRHGAGFDRHQTRLYNRFSNQKDPARFCLRAASVAKRAAAMDSPRLAANARSLVAELD